MQISDNDGQYDVALDRFELMLKTNDILFFDADEFENITYYYLENGKMSKAKKAIKLGLEQHPHSINLRLFHVEVLIFENKLNDANELLESLQEIEPSNEEVYIQRACILSKKNKHTEAIDALLFALNHTADEADVHSLIAMEYMFLEDYEQAKIHFIKCLESDADDYSSLYNVIYCFDFLEQPHQAILFLNKFLDKSPYSEVAWHQLGKQHVTLKQLEKALIAFDYAIISDDHFLGAYMEKGKVLEKLKRYQEAIDNYLITLELEDPTAFAYLHIGKCYDKLQQPELALQYFLKAANEDPLLDKVWNTLTDFYYKRKDFRKALYYINKAISIDEANVHYWKRFAHINKKLHFYEEAVKGFKKSLDLGNYELETWITRCDLLLELGEYELAKETLLQAKEFHPEAAEIYYRLSGVSFLINTPTEAYAYLKKATHIDAEYAFIMEELFPDVFKRQSIQNFLKSF